MKAFPCSSCGACCRLVYLNAWFRRNEFLRPDGACKHLAADNTCSIYADRPEACRINGIYEGAGLVNIVPIEVFHDHVIGTSCAPAIMWAGLDLSKIPARNYDTSKMLSAVNGYLAGIGSTFDGGRFPFASGFSLNVGGRQPPVAACVLGFLVAAVFEGGA